MPSSVGWLRRNAARVTALVLLVSVFYLGRLPSVSSEEAERLAAEYGFESLSIAMPSGLPSQTIRPVNQDYDRLTAWVSSVGAGIAMNDLAGDGLANDLCISDPRFDEVVVTPVPQGGPERYEPFVLDPGTLPVDRTMAPMGCVPGDYDADGRMDVLVYYWGRTPIIFLGRDGEAGEAGLTADSFRPVEMVDGVSSDGRYTGPLWNTNAVAVSDFDGDGFEDIFVGNYWPHSPVLDASVDGEVAMPDSLSYALNGGDSYIYRRVGETGELRYERAEGALPEDVPGGWVLGAAAADVDGDVRPELYLAHDFGLDRMLHNRSTPGDVRFAVVRGGKDPLVPKSKIMGRDSFKGMGVDFADFSGDGMYDIFVSNITTSYGIQESNLAFVGTAPDRAALRERLQRGDAPYEDRSAPLGLAWSGWAWDAKVADLNNSGEPEIVQTTGFIKGKVNRWPQLQEMATTNDALLSDPQLWPHLRAGDDLAGDQSLAFFARSDGGRYTDLSGELDMAVPVPTRGIAVGDADGDGLLDLAIARQWDEPVYYHNESPSDGAFLGLRLIRDRRAAADTAGDAAVVGSPVVDAQVRVTTRDGRTFVGHVDGGSGHAGKRSHNVHIGLGDASGPLTVELDWRGRDGRVREQVMRLDTGWHTLHLGSRAEEVAP